MTRSDLENLKEGIGLMAEHSYLRLKSRSARVLLDFRPDFSYFMSYKRVLTTRITFREKIEEERRKRNSTRLEAQQCVVSAFLQNWRE